MTSTRVLSLRFPKISKINKKIYFLSSHLLEKMLEMTDFDEWLSQRSKVVLRRLEQ